MIQKIKRILYKIGIKNYKIVKHTIHQSNIKYIRESDAEELKKDICYYNVFFENDNHIYRIDFSIMTDDEIKDTICKMLAQKQWYCDFVEDCFKDSPVPKVQNLEVFRIESSILKNLFSMYSNVSQVQYLFTNIKTECYLPFSSYQQVSSESSLSLLVQLIPNYPKHEIVVYNTKCIADITKEIKRQIDQFNAQMSISNSPPVLCCSKRVRLSPEITKTLISFLCNALHGDPILFGSSFITSQSFNTKILTNRLSLFRENSYNILDGEGQIVKHKYYIKDGVLLSAFNDIRSASYLSQTAGDTIIVADNLRAMIDSHNVLVSPCNENAAEGLPLFDAISGSQFYYNQITGDLYMHLLSTASGTSILINEHILKLFNKIECSVPCRDNVGEGTDRFELIVNLDKS